MSLTRNFDDLSNFLRNIDNNFTFVGLSETWLLHLENDVGIPGYNFINNPRKNKTGGVVGLYFSVDLNYKLRNDLNFNNTGCAESLFIEITNSNGKNIVVGVVYRPPNSDVNDFIQDMDSLITKISRENKICYLMGDFNLNLLNCENHKMTNEFLDIMYLVFGYYVFRFFPLITRPTRITSYTTTLIDNIFTNNLDNCIFSGLFFTDISDHLPIFCLL